MTILPDKFRTPTEAYGHLERDISVRKQELINLGAAVGSPKSPPVVRRSAVVMAYSHLEGGIKAGLGSLFAFINSQGLTWGSIYIELSYFEIDRRLAMVSLASNRRPVLCADEITKFFAEIQSRKAIFDVAGFLRGLGTINAEAIKCILLLCRIDRRAYESDLSYLNTGLVAVRHELAHGGLRPVDELTAATALDTVHRILDRFLSDFGYLMVSGSFRVDR